MRVFDWKSLGIAITAAGIGLWVLQPGSPGAAGKVEDRVAQLATRMHGVTPQTMADGSTLRAVQARGRTLTIRITDQADWTATSDDQAMTAMRTAELCSQADVRALIAAGAQVLIESSTAEGAPLPTLVVDRCGSS